MTGTILVVGASGFVGRVVVQDLLRRGKKVRGAARTRTHLPSEAEYVDLPDLSQPVADWTTVLHDVDQIVYLAARVHVMNDSHPDSLAAYRAVNRDAALSLARAAADIGVKRFVYLSSVKVNGESSASPLTEHDVPHPIDPYGVSKLEAEQALLQLGNERGLSVVVLRPPLVYGAGVKANFMALAKAAYRGIPLPIGAIQNRRSMVYVENLSDLISLVLTHPNASGEVFFVSDGEDLSTPQLTRLLAESQGARPYLPAIPVGFLRLVGRLTGKTNIIQRLTGSLQISNEKARALLGWTPPYPIWHALARTTKQLNPISNSKTTEGNLGGRVYLRIRSAIERFIALVMLVVLLPPALVIAALIKIDSRGPALFKQERAGTNHSPFLIYKFRTMHSNAPNISTEAMQMLDYKPITRFGKFLRRTSLDEMPQLMNIIKGEMSFIGPRPALPTQTCVLRLRQEAKIEHLLPGLTGYAQVTGRDSLTDIEKVSRDVYYARNISLDMDLKIIKMTLLSVFSGKGNK